MDPSEFEGYLAECRNLTLAAIREIVPRDARSRSSLYDLILDYPLRQAKALRPALCIATCCALGGRLECVLRSAAVLELYHNAFLIHDDVEDGSEQRREAPTLHCKHGIPIAVNVGDAMLALTLQPLLDNMATVGLGKALRILQVIARMARESAEGQAIELEWIHQGRWDLGDADYVRMVYKKTSLYTFVTPTLIGGIVANADGRRLATLRRFASLLDVAFQIQDDILNLTAEQATYGKEIAGDLWEGKHTLVLLHMMRTVEPGRRDRACAVLRKPRPGAPGSPKRLGASMELGPLLAGLQRQGELTARAAQLIEAATRVSAVETDGAVKTPADAPWRRPPSAVRTSASSSDRSTRPAACPTRARSRGAGRSGPGIRCATRPTGCLHRSTATSSSAWWASSSSATISRSGTCRTSPIS